MTIPTGDGYREIKQLWRTQIETRKGSAKGKG